MPRLALYALAVCALTLVAAVVSFAKGNWPVGVVWVLMVSLSSNMTIFYWRRAKAEKAAGQA